MHDVADVETEDPVFGAVVFEAEVGPCFDLKLLLCLEFAYLFERLKRYLQMFLLGHSVLEVVSSVFEREFADAAEFRLYGHQLVNEGVDLLHLLCEYLDFLRNVVRAAAV